MSEDPKMSGPHDTLTQRDFADSDELEGLAGRSEVVANACLALVSGRSSGRVFALINRDTLIGRASGANVRLEDKAASSHHAKVVRNGEGHQLIDLGSTNGTLLNGQRVTPDQPVELTLGDNIQIGETVLAYIPNHNQETAPHTQYLARVVPQAKTTDLRLPDAQAQALSQLLQLATAPEVEPKAATFDEQIDKFLNLVKIVRRNWVPLFAATALCALVGNASVFVSPPPSEASFSMRLTPSVSQNAMERSEQAHLEFYAAAQQNFMSPPLVERTMMSLGQPKPDQERLTATLGSLKFEGVSRQIYVGSYRDRDPQFAVTFLRRHLDNYLGSEIQKTIHVNQTQVEFLSARLKEREEELQRTENELREFKNKNIEGLPEYAQEHFTSREALYTRRSELSAQLSRTNLELGAARKRLAEESPLDASRVQSAQPYQQSLIDIRRRLAEARGRGLGDLHPDVVTLKRQAADMEALANQAKSTNATVLERNANPGLLALRHRVGDLEVAAKAAGAELGEVNAQLARLDNIFGKMPDVEARYAQLTRSYAVNKEMHAKLFEQLRESQLQLELERTSAQARYDVITPPESSGVQVRKVLVLRTLIGAAIGLILGVLIACVLELKRHMAARRLRQTALVPAGLTTRGPIIRG